MSAPIARSTTHTSGRVVILAGVSAHASRYDALLLLSFGGPDGPDDVMPFLRNVTAGRNVPDERLAVVAEQYDMFGGRSPINEQNLALIDALRSEFDAHGIDLPIWFGNRNWAPYVADAVRDMRDAGVRRALVLATSAFSSYSGCRQYREDLERAAAEVDGAPELEKLRLYYNHPGFVDAVVDRIGEVHRPVDRLVFTAHSIPNSMAQWCEYEPQLREMGGLVAGRIGADEWDLCYQSRSGPPRVPWLEPDVNDHLAVLADRGVTEVTLVPLGFVSDHMEVKFDLDHQAAATATDLGIDLRRAPTVGTHPSFVAGLRELVEEKVAGGEVKWVGDAGPWPDPCPAGHCLPPVVTAPGRPRGGPSTGNRPRRRSERPGPGVGHLGAGLLELEEAVDVHHRRQRVPELHGVVAGRDLGDDRPEVARSLTVGVDLGDDRRADVVADEGEPVGHRLVDHGVPRLVVERCRVCDVQPGGRQCVLGGEVA